VFREQQVDDVPAALADLPGMREDLDGGGDGEGAGGLEGALAFHFHHADPAHAGDAQVGMMAQGRNADADLLGGGEDGGAQGHLDLLAVDGGGHGSTDGFAVGGAGNGQRLLALGGPAAGLLDGCG
jgi:hypothetical protein